MSVTPFQEWPEWLSFSMAPWGYVVTIPRTECSETCVSYTCAKERCAEFPFTAKFDPRDCSVQMAMDLFGLHIKQEDH